MAQTPATRHSGDEYIDYTPASAVTAGDVVEVGTMPLVATLDIAANELGALAVCGVFSVPKTSDSFTAGDAVYWNNAGNPVTGTAGTGAADSATGNLMGTAVADAASGDSYVKVLLSAIKVSTTVAGAITSSGITGSDSSLGITGVTGSGSGGGAIAIAGGNGAGSNENGGAISINGGNAHGSGTDGAITIGTANTSSLTLGVMPRIPTATVAAAGTNQSTAAAITEGFTLVTGADDTKGVKLPSAVAGMVCIIKVGDGADLKVYPNTSDAINGLSADSAMTVVDDVCFMLIALDATTWYTLPLLPS